jgi:hypothetical protein
MRAEARYGAATPRNVNGREWTPWTAPGAARGQPWWCPAGRRYSETGVGGRSAMLRSCSDERCMDRRCCVAPLGCWPRLPDPRGQFLLRVASAPAQWSDIPASAVGPLRHLDFIVGVLLHASDRPRRDRRSGSSLRRAGGTRRLSRLPRRAVAKPQAELTDEAMQQWREQANAPDVASWDGLNTPARTSGEPDRQRCVGDSLRVRGLHA